MTQRTHLGLIVIECPEHRIRPGETLADFHARAAAVERLMLEEAAQEQFGKSLADIEKEHAKKGKAT